VWRVLTHFRMLNVNFGLYLVYFSKFVTFVIESRSTFVTKIGIKAGIKVNGQECLFCTGVALLR
jgi:hypothetical protein